MVRNLKHDEADTDQAFSIELDINYEDTDAGGVVYYGNYLAYMERARNAFLRERGYPLTIIEQNFQVIIVVTQAQIQYHAPARLDDRIRVTLDVTKIGAARILFHHQVLRDHTLLVSAEVDLATIHNQSFKPLRIPNELKHCFYRDK